MTRPGSVRRAAQTPVGRLALGIFPTPPRRAAGRHYKDKTCGIRCVPGLSNQTIASVADRAVTAMAVRNIAESTPPEWGRRSRFYVRGGHCIAEAINQQHDR